MRTTIRGPKLDGGRGAGRVVMACAVALSGVALGACASGGRASAPASPAVARRAGSGTVPGDTVQVGYGTQDRRRSTGAVGSVSGNVARREHMTRVEEMLRRIPGVMVRSNSDGNFSVSIRGAAQSSLYGNTEPLVVIDGVPVVDGAGALRAMPPEDVERIDVLKDAEASIYGARAANGVILVRTRHAEPARGS